MGCGAFSGRSDHAQAYQCEENLPLHMRKNVTVLKGERAAGHLLVQKTDPERARVLTIKDSLTRKHRRELESHPGYIPEMSDYGGEDDDSVFFVNRPRGYQLVESSNTMSSGTSVSSQAGVSQASVSQAGVSQARVSQAGVSQARVSKAGVSQAGVPQARVPVPQEHNPDAWSERKKQEGPYIPAHIQGEVTNPSTPIPSWGDTHPKTTEEVVAVGSALDTESGESVWEKQKKRKFDRQKSFNVSYNAIDEERSKRKETGLEQLKVEARYKLDAVPEFDPTMLSGYRDLDYMHVEKHELAFMDRLPVREYMTKK